LADVINKPAGSADDIADSAVRVQSVGFVLVLSPDWLILRASENTHGFFGHYHQRMIGEPLSSYTLSQPLHDLRNSLARQQSASGISRAFRVRLTDEPRYFDISFQVGHGRIVLEGMASEESGSGSPLGSVSRLIYNLPMERDALLDHAARRMRALTGFDRVTLTVPGGEAESSRSGVSAMRDLANDLPPLLVDAAEKSLGLFPLAQPGGAAGQALLRSPSEAQLAALREHGVRSLLNVPVMLNGDEHAGWFRCENRAAVHPSFELHAAAELFSQVFALCWERS
jgi:light-regulated signal transduction histidine kinase (bacteriophytochrome)